MSSVLLQGIDADELRAEIVADVVSAIRPLLHGSPEALLVDGDRMAELAGVSRPTIDRLVRDGTIPSVMVGRRRLYRPHAVIAALEAASTKEPRND